MDHMMKPAGRNLLVTAAIRAAIDHAQRYGDLETAAELIVILDGCGTGAGGLDSDSNRFSYLPVFTV
jgi:hypothetical protein